MWRKFPVSSSRSPNRKEEAHLSLGIGRNQSPSGVRGERIFFLRAELVRESDGSSIPCNGSSTKKMRCRGGSATKEAETEAPDSTTDDDGDDRVANGQCNFLAGVEARGEEEEEDIQAAAMPTAECENRLSPPELDTFASGQPPVAAHGNHEPDGDFTTIAFADGSSVQLSLEEQSSLEDSARRLGSDQALQCGEGLFLPAADFPFFLDISTSFPSPSSCTSFSSCFTDSSSESSSLAEDPLLSITTPMEDMTIKVLRSQLPEGQSADLEGLLTAARVDLTLEEIVRPTLAQVKRVIRARGLSEWQEQLCIKIRKRRKNTVNDTSTGTSQRKKIVPCVCFRLQFAPAGGRGRSTCPPCARRSPVSARGDTTARRRTACCGSCTDCGAAWSGRWPRSCRRGSGTSWKWRRLGLVDGKKGAKPIVNFRQS